MAEAGNGKAVFLASNQKDDMEDKVRTHTNTQSYAWQIMKLLIYALRPALTELSIEWEGLSKDVIKRIRQTPFRFPPLFSGDRVVAYAFLPPNIPACSAILKATTTAVREQTVLVYDRVHCIPSSLKCCTVMLCYVPI